MVRDSIGNHWRSFEWYTVADPIRQPEIMSAFLTRKLTIANGSHIGWTAVTFGLSNIVNNVIQKQAEAELLYMPLLHS